MAEWLCPLQGLFLHNRTEDIAGYVASALVLATFVMTSMRPLRLMAICSNLAFLYYAFVTGTRPILLLHAILLPINIFRLAQMESHRGQQPPPRTLNSSDSPSSI